MKSAIATTLLLSTLALAAPSPRAASTVDTADEMDAVISGKAKCKTNAVLFARGTFDSGNIGVWVGPALQKDVKYDFDNDVSFQGVSEKDYPASLTDYVKTSGSKTCATSCAKTVTDYVKKCPTANIFLSGWSQGALCIHTCIDALKSSPALKNVKGITTFGDEAKLMDPKVIPAFPKDIPVEPYCVTDTAAPDVLCTDSLTSGFKIPDSIFGFKSVVVDAITDVLKVAVTPDQRTAAAKLPFTLASNFLGVTDYFLKDVKDGKVRRWMVLPQHFKYANNEMTMDASKWMKKQVKK